MRFDWDETKNQTNILKHGIDFLDVIEMFDQPMLTFLDRRVEYGEERWVAIGALKSAFAVVVYTERLGDVIRLISARRATRKEAKRYVEHIEN